MIAIAVDPDRFDAESEAPWVCGDEVLWENPRLTLPRWAFAMLRLWRLFQGGGMGVGHLPEAGGAMDQPVAMIEAFAIMGQAEAELTDTGRPGVITRKDERRILAAIDRAKELYPDGEATGALLAAVRRSRGEA